MTQLVRAIDLAPKKATGAVPLVAGFYLRPTGGLIIHGEPDWASWERAGAVLCAADRGVQFAIGDWLNEAERRFGEQYAQLISPEDGWSETTIRVYRWLARRIAPDDRRMDRLTMRHHMLVAAMEPAEQRRWLTVAAADDEEQPWSVRRLAQAIMAQGTGATTAWWVLVEARSAADQAALLDRMTSEGRSAKAVTRRRL